MLTFGGRGEGGIENVRKCDYVIYGWTLSPGRQDDVMSDDSISIKVGKFLDKDKSETI